ncbi:hypothetical protein B0O80DRAFT_426225 [Mortierella sp. GBAus27b]|nr:hypothetical protein B0O80DRAFT_426225 [Mortierella sp. GBAus27b]
MIHKATFRHRRVSLKNSTIKLQQHLDSTHNDRAITTRRGSPFGVDGGRVLALLATALGIVITHRSMPTSLCQLHHPSVYGCEPFCKLPQAGYCTVRVSTAVALVNPLRQRCLGLVASVSSHGESPSDQRGPNTCMPSLHTPDVFIVGIANLALVRRQNGH